MKYFQIILSLSFIFVGVPIFSQPVIIDVTTTPVDCHGGSTGSITFAVTGGTKPYYYYIIQGGITQSSPQTNDTVYTFTNVTAGIYLCIIEDNNSLNDFRNRTISQPPPIQITSVNTSPISCTGFTDGKIDITASGESGNYNFVLRPLELSTVTGSFDMIAPGNYRVVVSDASGCLSKDSTDIITFSDPLPISIVDETIADISCNGSNNGIITINASGGTGTYTFTLNPGGIAQSSGTFTNLSPGTYTIEVTDLNSCPGATSNPLTINEPAPLQFTLQTSTNTSCFGVNDGTITVNASGGIAPYSFTLNPGGDTNSTGIFTGLASATYTVSLTDSKSCGPVTSNDLIITQPAAITIASTNSSNITCNNFNDGIINVTASGGNAPLTYTLNPGAISQPTGNFTDLSAGTYTVTVTDIQGCNPATTTPITIANPALINISGQTVNQITCNGAMDGAIIITAEGGTGTLSYTLNPGADTNTTGIFTGLGPGTYTVNVTDANSCPQVVTGIITIIEPVALQISVNGSSRLVLDCYGDNTGTININVSGGTTPYAYSWTGPGGFTSALKDITDLLSGSYNLTVTDSNSCVSVLPNIATITEPSQIQISLSKTDLVCNGDANGTITVNASGGTPPYQYSLDGITYQASNIFTGLAKNLYTINVRDNNSCVRSDNISVDEPEKLIITSEIMIDGNLCFGDALGEIRIEIVTGGTPPYEYSINGGVSFSSTSVYTNLPGGSYQTVVRDSKGCIANGNLNIIIQPLPISISSYSQTDVTGCFGNLNGEISIEALGGTGSLNYRLNSDPLVSTGLFTGLGAGNYTITITDTNNCIKDTSVVISQPLPLVFTALNITDVTSCAGDTNGEVQASASGGTGPIQYSLDGVNWQSDGIFPGLGGGTYVVSARDSMNCRRDSMELIVFQPDPLIADISSSPYINEYSKGSIHITNISGGTGAYSFSINGMAGPFTSQTSYTDLNTGIYEVLVRDQNNCTYSESVEIIVMPPLNVSVTLIQPTCNGLSNGSIMITVTNHSGDLQYSIDDSVTWHTNNEFTNLGGGTYRIAVKEGTGRYFSDVVTLIEPLPMNILSTITPASCNAFSPDASITISVTGGTGTKTYQWSDGPVTKDRFNMNSGTYNLMVTDQNSCEMSRSIFVPANTIVIANAGTDTTVCEGSILDLNGTGGTVFSWSPATGLSNPNIYNPTATITSNISYVLTVAGANDCYNTDTINIGIYPKLGLFAGNDTAVIKNNPVPLNATGGPYISYIWQPASGLSNPAIPDPVATPSSSQLYVVTALDQNGCNENDTVSITIIEDLVIYNSFSPNDDGINDYWDIDHAEFYTDIIVEVYNRWGEKFFSSRGYTSEKRWDGTHRGKKAPIGTYYFVVIPYKGADAITGPLTIIR